jgi:hypothetical protein
LIEFAVVDAADEGVPFGWGELEDALFRGPAIADADSSAGQAGDLDAVAIGEAQRTLDPVKTRDRSFHVITPLIAVVDRTRSVIT